MPQESDQVKERGLDPAATALPGLAWAAGLCIAFVLVAYGYDYDVVPNDEGSTVHQSNRILQGEVMYRDFANYYPPGIYYLTAVLFGIFGPSLIVSRLSTVAYVCLIAAGMAAVGRCVAPGRLGIWPALFVVAWPMMEKFHGLGILPFLPPFLFGCAAMHRSLETRSTPWMAASGVLAGIAITMRHDLGGCAVLAQLAVIVGFGLAGKRGLSASIQPAAVYAAALAAITVPVATYFLLRAGWSNLVDQLVLAPMTIYPGWRNLPYPSLFPALDPGAGAIRNVALAGLSLLYYLPFLIHAATIAALAGRWRQAPSEASTWTVLYLSLVQFAFYIHLLGRADKWHLLPAACLSALLLVALAEWLGMAGMRRVRIVALGLGACGLIFPCADKIEWFRKLQSPEGRYEFQVPRARGIWGSHFNPVVEDGRRYTFWELYELCIRYVQQVVPPDEPIFVSMPRHDKLIYTDNLFYFLTERRSGTGLDLLHPGLTTRRDVQERIVADLDRAGVRYFVRQTWDAPEWDSQKHALGSKFLDEYFNRTLQPVASFKYWEVWRRK